MRRPAVASLLCLLLAAAVAAGCGDSGDGARMPRLTVALDFTPNPVHAPIYTTVREGLDRRNGIRIAIEQPGSQPDSLKALLSGRADIGILDIQDLGLARTKGEDVVAIGALVDRPLAALIAQPGIHRPRDLDGGRVGVSGLPSDPAFLRAIVRADGGDYASIPQVTIGFNAVSALLTRKVDAVPAFWNVEGVTLRQRGRDVREFRVERYGAPPYPEVVLLTTRRTLERRRDDVMRFLTAVRAGAASVERDPEPAVRQIAQAAGNADPAAVRAQLRALKPVVDPSLRFDRAVLERWSAFAARIGILPRRVDVGRAFALDLAGR
jgi:NitT/TauT family transport system substrate-binding protein/putative hydroxymethylpyrimidine transport system substrate-binding protein